MESPAGKTPARGARRVDSPANGASSPQAKASPNASGLSIADVVRAKGATAKIMVRKKKNAKASLGDVSTASTADVQPAETVSVAPTADATGVAPAAAPAPSGAPVIETNAPPPAIVVETHPEPPPVVVAASTSSVLSPTPVITVERSHQMQFVRSISRDNATAMEVLEKYMREKKERAAATSIQSAWRGSQARHKWSALIHTIVNMSRARRGKEGSNLPTSITYCDSTDTTTNISYQIKGGTVQKLVERLCSTSYEDAELTHVVLTTYRAFSTPELFARYLVLMFNATPNPTTCSMPSFVAVHQVPLQLKVLGVILEWMQTASDDLRDGAAHACLRALFEAKEGAHAAVVPCLDGMLAYLDELSKLGFPAPAPFPASNAGADAPVSTLPPTKGELEFFDLDPLEVARQLALINRGLLAAIRPREYLRQAWSKNGKELAAPHILALIARFNEIGQWVCTLILMGDTVARRAQTITRLVDLASRSRELNDFHTVMGIISGLNNACISRLKHTLKMLSEDVTKRLAELESIMDFHNNYSSYRKALTAAINEGPCVPYLAVHLHDLFFIDDKDGTPANNKDFILLGKHRETTSNIDMIVETCKRPYNLTPVVAIQHYLLAFNFSLSEKEQDRLSLLREPRDMDFAPNPYGSRSVSQSLDLNSIVASESLDRHVQERLDLGRRFELLPNERVLHHCSCIQRGSFYGKLYVTQRAVYFLSELVGMVRKNMILLHDIKEVTGKKELITGVLDFTCTDGTVLHYGGVVKAREMAEAIEDMMSKAQADAILHPPAPAPKVTVPLASLAIPTPPANMALPTPSSSALAAKIEAMAAANAKLREAISSGNLDDSALAEDDNDISEVTRRLDEIMRENAALREELQRQVTPTDPPAAVPTKTVGS